MLNSGDDFSGYWALIHPNLPIQFALNGQGSYRDSTAEELDSLDSSYSPFMPDRKLFVFANDPDIRVRKKVRSLIYPRDDITITTLLWIQSFLHKDEGSDGQERTLWEEALKRRGPLGERIVTIYNASDQAWSDDQREFFPFAKDDWPRLWDARLLFEQVQEQFPD